MTDISASLGVMPDGIDVDPDLTSGTLPNGLSYYVKQNSKPEKQVVLRLVVRAGSMQEEEHERGIAHFVEHMGFKGTKSFGPQGLIKFFESIGARFGADLNAHTGLEETVYKLQIPTNAVGAAATLEQGLSVMSEWASSIRIRCRHPPRTRARATVPPA